LETDIKATKAHRFPEEAFDASWLFLTAAGLFQNELCDRRARFKGEFAGENDMSFGAETIDRVVDFHGHSCPGLSIGIRVSELARERLGRAKAEDLVAVVETDMCGVDAIQYLTGCTYGKGNLVHKDYGKMAFSFFDRKSGKGFRALLRPEAQERAGGGELRGLMKRWAAGTLSEEEKDRCEQLRGQAGQYYMNAPLSELFEVSPLPSPAPRPPRILESLTCENCGEMTMESRTRRFAGRTLCIPCFEAVEQKA
jgi:formylmethanofuran dehydrogenase subunit E